MLGDHDAIATVAVKDVKAARTFYQETLRFNPEPSEEESVLIFRSGSSKLLVYQSEHAGTNRATAVNWFLGDDLDGVVQDLKSRGVTFEHYDFPGMTLEGDIHVMGEMRAAWFKDPDGNILAFMS